MFRRSSFRNRKSNPSVMRVKNVKRVCVKGKSWVSDDFCSLGHNRGGEVLTFTWKQKLVDVWRGKRF